MTEKMTRTQIVEALARIVDEGGLQSGDVVAREQAVRQLTLLGQKATAVLEERPKLFVSTSGGIVFDIASDDLIDTEVYVIDESSLDDQGFTATIDTQDGSEYTARIKRMAVTAPHFEVDQVVEATRDVVYANGMKL